MNRKTYHIGLWNYAREFFKAAEKLRGIEDTVIDIPTYYLYCHSIELALKALLVCTGSDEKELRMIGHDLKIALVKALKKGLDVNLSNLGKVKITIELINPYYQAKELEYIYTGRKQFPAILHMSTSAADVIRSVGMIINIPVTQQTV